MPTWFSQTFQKISDALNKDLVSGANAKLRNKQREKIADVLFDLAKYLATSLLLGSIVTSSTAGISIGLIAIIVAVFLGSVFLIGIGMAEMSRMEDEA